RGVLQDQQPGRIGLLRLRHEFFSLSLFSKRWAAATPCSVASLAMSLRFGFSRFIPRTIGLDPFICHCRA
ncbi:MAG: hypothetical protein ACXW3N_12665, partial [Rhodoplanes sp.]